MAQVYKPISEGIEELERVREEGDHARALQIADALLYQAASSGSSTKVVEVLQHRLEIYKHAFQQTGQEMFLELMRADITTGISLVATYELPQDTEAVFVMRLGDTYLHQGDARSALPHYERAYSLIDPNTNPARSSEFLSHLGYARARAGDLEQAGKDLLKSLELAESAEGLRPFHYLVIVSGIYLRLAEWAHTAGSSEVSSDYLKEAAAMAHELKTTYHMTMRQVHVENLQKKLSEQTT